jgi:RNA polymerase sigma factor (sigma-70 family)
MHSKLKFWVHQLLHHKNYNESKLLHAIDNLGDRHRRIVLERYQEGMTLNQIGKKNGISKERARQIIQLAQNQLRYFRGSIMQVKA